MTVRDGFVRVPGDRARWCNSGAGDRASTVLAIDPLVRWLDANVSTGSRRFHLTDDQGYEIGERSLPAIAKS